MLFCWPRVSLSFRPLTGSSTTAQGELEVTAPGFDGGTDETDHLVFWVSAATSADVDAAIKDTGAKNCGQIPDTQGDEIDFHLPADADRLVKAIKGETLGDKTVKLVVDAFATDEYADGPSYAVITVTRKLLNRLAELVHVCKEHGLSEARFTGYPVWGPGDIDDELRLQNGEMVILPGGSVWYTDYPKFGDYRIESRADSISGLTAAFESNSDGSVAFLTDSKDTRELYERHSQPEEETESAD